MDDEVKVVLKISGPNLDRDELIVGRQGLRAGRSSDNNLTLNHTEISRQHMRIYWRDDDKYLVEDLNSRNGIVLNGIRLQARVPAEINIGDRILAGPYTLTVERFIYAEPLAVLKRPMVVEDTQLGPVPDKHIEANLPGIPRDKSTWLKYLPEVFAQDEFIGRYLLIFESIMSPIVWMIDNFDLYISPEVAPQAWLEWMAGWFDLLLLPELPIERQRQVMDQMGWLFLRRGTPAGLQRLLELYFGVMPEIIEDEPCSFVVRLPLSQSSVKLPQDVADRLIQSQKPAFAAYKLEVF